MATILRKQPAESKEYSMDFRRNMKTDETISAVNSLVSSPAGLTIDTPSVSGKKVVFRVSGGTSGQSYSITILVQTSASNILEGDGILVVEDIF